MPVLARTRPPNEALFRVEAKVIQRSRGRSAVAAAAYRAAVRLTDDRTGLTFDYLKKREVISSFIMSPEGAPGWTMDREALWSKAERAEKHPRAVTAREVIVTIPRELPEAQREAFLRAALAPYIHAGAVADVAVHAPQAADGDEQPHAHILLTTRRLAAEGFQTKKNDELTAFFESGGRHGRGARGEALKQEVHDLAERWRQRGYHDLTEAPEGVWVHVGRSEILDSGDRTELHGPITDDAIHAMVLKAKEDWNGQQQIWGCNEFKERIWLESQRQGVEVTNYEPPPRIREEWEAEQAKEQKQTIIISAAATQADEIREALRYARGERDEPPQTASGRAVASMDEQERAKLSRLEPFEAAPQIAALIKQAELAAPSAGPAPAAQVKPEPEPPSAPSM